MAPDRPRILVIEDDLLIALMIEDMVREGWLPGFRRCPHHCCGAMKLPSATLMLYFSTSISVDDPTRKLRTFCWTQAGHSHS